MIRSALLAVCLLTVACSHDHPAAQDVAIEIPFKATVNGQPFHCGETYAQVGSPGVAFTLTDFRFYVHDVAVVGHDGKTHPVVLDAGPFQSATVALLDFEDGCGSDGTTAMHTSLQGRAATDQFHELRFTVGVPTAQNFVDLATAAPPLDVTGMFWIWQFGYRFLKIDGNAGSDSFFVHLGASGCPGSNAEMPPTGACANPNEALISIGMSSGKSVAADIGSLLAASNLSVNTAGTAPGCMSEVDDPDCAPLMPRLGVGAGAAQKLFAAQ